MCSFNNLNYSFFFGIFKFLIYLELALWCEVGAWLLAVTMGDCWSPLLLRSVCLHPVLSVGLGSSFPALPQLRSYLDPTGELPALGDSQSSVPRGTYDGAGRPGAAADPCSLLTDLVHGLLA